MLDATLNVVPGGWEGPGTSYVVVKDGVRCPFRECTDTILAVPEDYKLELIIRLVLADNPELLNTAPKVFVGVDVYDCVYNSACSDGEPGWTVDWDTNEQLPHVAQPFRGIPGRHEIKIVAGFGTGQSIECSFFVEVLATRQSANEIRGLLDAIDMDYDQIDELCLKGHAGSSSFISLIDRAEELEELFSSNWVEFSRRIRRRYEPSLEIKPNGMPNSPEAIYWLSSNPEALGYCLPEERQFSLDSLPVKAAYAAEEVVKASGKLYENQVIAGFFEQVETKLSDLLKFIHNSSVVSGDLPLVRYANYISYHQIVHEYSLSTLARHEGRIKKLQDKFFRMYRNFRLLTGIRGNVRPVLPEITPFAARNPLYRTFFNAIDSWYKLCKSRVELNDFACHFIKLDKLYEFTVLTKIVHSLQDLGFTSKAREWHDMSELCFGGKAQAVRPSSSPFNYYKWTLNDRLTLEMWYEPRIYTLKNAAENDLVVIKSEYYNSSSYYLTPDFVFKIKWANRVLPDYFIMDAKHSSDKSVQRNYIKSLTEKYLNSVNVRTVHNLQNPIKAIWAIYARGADWISGYGIGHSIEGAYTVFPSIGGVLVNSGTSDVFSRSFMVLIDKLEAMHEYEESMFMQALRGGKL